MKGLVIKSTGTSYGVYFENGTTADCHVKGNFRIRGIRSTNPVAIGDYVEVTPTKMEPTGSPSYMTVRTTSFVVQPTSVMPHTY